MGNAFPPEKIPAKDTSEEPFSYSEANEADENNSRETNEKACNINDTAPHITTPQSGIKESGAPRESLLRSLLSRFERGFEIDDLLLLGLILLILQGKNSEREGRKDEMVLILAFLFLTGF